MCIANIATHPDIWKLHEESVAAGESFYEDPVSGLCVFTSAGLEKRGKCCGSGCRHCPFTHSSVPENLRSRIIQQPSWLTPLPDSDRPVDLLFWSGGKDSYLTLREIERSSRNRPVLATTFDASHRTVAHQELELESVIRQARHLGLPLLGIPLHPGRDYLDAVGPALRLIPFLDRLVFGDLHLEHIRKGREEALQPLADELEISLAFPLWKADYEWLMRDLEESGITIEISSTTPAAKGAVKLKDRFNRSLLESLPDSVDAFGENGEFHTLAKVWESR
ncbi:MAG: DUF5522 domain-containing protein [Verrucomicrobiota bacterium]